MQAVENTGDQPVAVVTGATSGIGAAVARALTGRGFAVVGTGRDQDRLRALAEHVALPLTLDLSRPDDVRRAAQTVIDRFQRVDLLVNNAGVGHFAHADDCTDADFSRLLDVNLMGAVRLTRAVLPTMISRGEGVVVNVASVAGVRGYPEHAAYCASKHALVGWSKALRKDLTHSGVHVVVVCPPAVDTPFFQNAGRPDFLKGRGRIPIMSADDAAAGLLRAVDARARMAVLGPRARALHLADRLVPGLIDRLQLWRELRGSR